MKLIPKNIVVGTRLKLHAFGFATVKKIYFHNDTQEVCADVKSDSGDCLHLSLEYVQKVLA